MSLTTRDLDQIKGIMDASIMASEKRTAGLIKDSEIKVMAHTYRVVQESEERTNKRFDKVDEQFEQVYEHTGDVANEVFVTVKGTTDDHERRIKRLER